MIQSPYTLKNMTITTPMTAAMEVYNWLNEKLLRSRERENKEGYLKMSPMLEKYFSSVEVRAQQEILNSTLKDVSERVAILEKKQSEETRHMKLKEDRKQEIIQLYFK